MKKSGETDICVIVIAKVSRDVTPYLCTIFIGKTVNLVGLNSQYPGGK